MKKHESNAVRKQLRVSFEFTDMHRTADVVTVRVNRPVGISSPLGHGKYILGGELAEMLDGAEGLTVLSLLTKAHSRNAFSVECNCRQGLEVLCDRITRVLGDYYGEPNVIVESIDDKRTVKL